MKPDNTGGTEPLRSHAAGDDSFSVTDRLAVINLINSYGYYVDELQMDNFFSLFSDVPTVEFWQGATLITAGWESFRESAISRQEVFKREQIQRRHVLSAPRFERQGSDALSGHVYLQLYKAHMGTISLVTMGYYTFTAIRQRGEWKLDRWIARVDAMPD